jgi:Divergent InlB B-repeat domain
MKTFALILSVCLLAPLALFAQSSTATVVYTKTSPADAFVTANVGTTLVKADQNGLTFKRAGNHYTYVAGPGLTYQQNGQWLPTKLQVGAQLDGSGWALSGTAMNVTLMGNKGQDKDVSVSAGAVTFDLHAPQLAYGGADTFTFQEGSTNWRLRATEATLAIEATVSKRQGKAGGLHTFGFTAPGVGVQIDENGQLHAGGQVHISHPLIVGANKKLYFVCGPWASSATTLSFSCDDTTLPDAAFPYVIDPTVTSGPPYAGPTYLEQTGAGCCGQTNISFAWWAYFDVTRNLPDNTYITNETLNTGSLSWSVQSDPGLAPADCTADSSGNGGIPSFAIGFHMSYNADSYTHGCIANVTGADTMSVSVDYVPAITTPDVYGPSSVIAGTSYSYTAGSAQTGSGSTPQYQINWGDGTNTGWLPVGTQSASHTWNSVGSYNVTSQAQDPWNQVYVATSSVLSVSVAPLIPVTVTTNAANNVDFTVDGSQYTGSQTFQWAPGSQHTLSAPSPQQNGNGVQYAFSNWSDNGAATHTITVPSSAITYTAIFTIVSAPVVITTSVTGIGLTITADGVNAPAPYTANWIPGTVHTIAVSTPQTGTDGKIYAFSSWSDSGAVAHTITVPNGGVTYSATVIPETGMTIATSPPGLALAVDGAQCTSPCTFQWLPGSQHTISTAQIQGSGATQYVFAAWSDSGAMTHSIVAPSAPSLYTASFLTQYYLTTSANPPAGGTISPVSGWYNAGQVVSITATANSGYPFVGFTGSIGGTTTPQNLAITAPENVTANFAAVQTNVPFTALPSSQTVAPGGTTGYTITVLGTAGFAGTFGLAVTGQPQGVSAVISPQTLDSSGSSVLTITTSGSQALGNYALTITASNTSLTLTTMAFLTVAAPTQPAWVDPPSGSNLSAGETAFAWDSGLGATQYQLILGSAPGLSDIFSGDASSSQSASALLPATGQPQPIYGTLKSLIAGVWQPQPLTYTLNAGSPGTGVSSSLFNSAAYSVDNGGVPSQPWNYCVTSSPGHCVNNNFDAGYINGCEVLLPEGQYAAHDPYVSVKVTAVGSASSSHLKNTFDAVFTADSAAPHGPRYLLCKYGTQTLSLQNAVTVYDAPPQILQVTQYPPQDPGGPFYATLWGRRFGPAPGMAGSCVYESGPFNQPCADSADLQLIQANPDGSPPTGAPYAYWSDNQINVLLTPAPTASGLYDLMIKSSLGENGNGFSANSQDYPPGQSNRKSVTVTPAPASAQITMGSALVVSGAATSPTSPNIVSVGQQIPLTGSVTGLASGISLSSQTWLIEGATVASYVQKLDYNTTPTTSYAVKTPLTQDDLSKPKVTFYWIDGDDGGNTVTYKVTYTAVLSDQTQAVATAYFRPIRPSPVSFSGTVTTRTPVIYESDSILPSKEPSLNFGYKDPDFGIRFDMAVSSTFGGQFGLVQLINVNHTVTLATGVVATKTSGTAVLDDKGDGTVSQYSGSEAVVDVPAMKSAEFSLTDNTAMSLTGATAASGNDAFQVYLMYQPPGTSSIWVTLTKLSWSWSGSVSLVNGSWAVSADSSFFPSPAGAVVKGALSTELPTWSGNVRGLIYK